MGLPGGRAARPVQAADGDAHRGPEGRAEEHPARLGPPCEKGPQGHSDPGECPPPSESPRRCPRGSGGPGVAQRVTGHEGSPARNVVSEEPVPPVLGRPCALPLTAISLPTPEKPGSAEARLPRTDEMLGSRFSFSRNPRSLVLFWRPWAERVSTPGAHRCTAAAGRARGAASRPPLPSDTRDESAPLPDAAPRSAGGFQLAVCSLWGGADGPA